MLTTFFALILMFTVNSSLLPNAFKPQSPIVYRGSSRPAVVPNFLIKGPAAVTDTVVISPDSTCIITVDPPRADSLEAGKVNPETFTPEEEIEQYWRARHLWLERREFL